jgi:hypothetical protein
MQHQPMVQPHEKMHDYEESKCGGKVSVQSNQFFQKSVFVGQWATKNLSG